MTKSPAVNDSSLRQKSIAMRWSHLADSDTEMDITENAASNLTAKIPFEDAICQICGSGKKLIKKLIIL